MTICRCSVSRIDLKLDNIIRERLSASVSAVRQGTAPSASPGPSFHHDITSISGPAQHSLQDLINLYAEAENKCASLAPTVVELLQRHHGDSLVQLDAAFVLPGVIYAAKYYMVRFGNVLAPVTSSQFGLRARASPTITLTRV